MLRYIKLLVALSTLIAHSVYAVNAPLTKRNYQVPAGLYVLIRPGIAVSDAILSSDLVHGVVLRGDWPTIEPSPNTLSLEYYLTELDRIHASGKVASLVINNGGVNTPSHVVQGVQQTIGFTNKNRFHKTFGDEIRIPVFWDAHLLREKKRLVENLAKKVAHHPALKLVSVQCANATTDDWNIPVSKDWQRIGFSEEKLLAACKAMIDHHARYFPDQALRMAIGGLPKELSPQRQSVSRGIFQYVSEHYPERFYLQRHNLSTKTPLASGNNRMYGWQLIREAYPFAAAQLLWPLTDDSSCRMNGGKKPCDPAAMLNTVADISESYGFRYVEIYGADFKRLAATPGFTAWAKKTQAVEHSRRKRMSKSAQEAPDRDPAALRASRGSTKNAKDYPRSKSMRNHSQKESADLTNDSWGQWYNPPQASTQRGLTSHHFFNSESIGEKVGYSLYLPKPQALGQQKYPVIYWLHGKKGNETRGAYIAGYLDRAITLGHIRPTAMVFVNGGQHSFYADSFDGKRPVERMIVDELMPHVEANHPISSQRKDRLLEGFSMGGFGALRLAAKYPDKFASVAIFGAALLDKTFMPRRSDVSAYNNVFNQDAGYFVKNTPLYWLEQNSELISDSGMRIRMRSGSKDGTRRYNDHMHKQLNRLNIQHDFYQYDNVGHAPRRYYDKDEYGSFKFHEVSMKGMNNSR